MDIVNAPDDWGVMTGSMEWHFRGQSFQFAHSSLHASWFTHEDERDIRETLCDIKPGDIVFDVGCGFGSYALCALAAGAAKVYCWTPLGFEIRILQESMKLNGWDDKYELFQMALYSRSGSINPDDLAFSEDTGAQPFETITLDEATASIETNGRCWLKMDVEGAEVEVLKGASEFIERSRPILLIENHIFKIPGIDGEVRNIVESYGYDHQQTIAHHQVTHSLFSPK